MPARFGAVFVEAIECFRLLALDAALEDGGLFCYFHLTKTMRHEKRTMVKTEPGQIFRSWPGLLVCELGGFAGVAVVLPSVRAGLHSQIILDIREPIADAARGEDYLFREMRIAALVFFMQRCAAKA